MTVGSIDTGRDYPLCPKHNETMWSDWTYRLHCRSCERANRRGQEPLTTGGGD